MGNFLDKINLIVSFTKKSEKKKETFTFKYLVGILVIHLHMQGTAFSLRSSCIYI